MYVIDKALELGSTTINQPSVFDFSNTEVVDCGYGNCVDTDSFRPSDFELQRTAIRSSTDKGYNFYQTIYGFPNSSQVILESLTETIAPSSTDRVEVGLLSYSDLTQPDALAHLM
ncbi:hypothetical protein ACPV5V_25205, partial [Vibrio campbellii]